MRIIFDQSGSNDVASLFKRPRFVARLTVVVLCFATAVCGQETDGSDFNRDSVAVLIGCDDYDSLKDLAFCDSDVRSLRCALQGLGFRSQNISLLFSKADARSGRPTRANILDVLDDELTKKREGETLIIVFCGHGVFFEGKSRLCPQDASASRVVETTISVDELLAKAARTSFKKKLLIVDACRDASSDPSSLSDASVESLDAEVGFLSGLPTPKRDADNLVVFSSCSEGQRAVEWKAFSHGVFTHFLLNALSGDRDVSQNGEITLYSVVDYVTNKTVKFCAKIGRKQTPCLHTVGEIGVFTLGKLSDRVPTLKNSLGMEFSVLPGGSFEFGSQEKPKALVRAFNYYYAYKGGAKEAWFEDEYPPKKTTVKPFALARCETTVAEFRRFVEETGYVTDAEKKKGGFGVEKGGLIKRSPSYTWKNPHYLIDDETYPQEECFPVVNVSWNDAVAYCEWLSDKTGEFHRLPTQIEWEYAARAGTKTRYWFGNDPEELSKYDNVADESARKYFPDWGEGVLGDDRYPFAAPVDATTPNPWGLFGVCGNVCEWCWDVCESAPTRKNIRGGSWYNWSNIARASNKHSGRPDDQACFIGFRVLMEITGEALDHNEAY